MQILNIRIQLKSNHFQQKASAIESEYYSGTGHHLKCHREEDKAKQLQEEEEEEG